jgi:hypothetical protein
MRSELPSTHNATWRSTSNRPSTMPRCRPSTLAKPNWLGRISRRPASITVQTSAGSRVARCRAVDPRWRTKAKSSLSAASRAAHGPLWDGAARAKRYSDGRWFVLTSLCCSIRRRGWRAIQRATNAHRAANRCSWAIPMRPCSRAIRRLLSVRTYSPPTSAGPNRRAWGCAYIPPLRARRAGVAGVYALP